MLLAKPMHLAFLLGTDQIKAFSTLGCCNCLCCLDILGSLHCFGAGTAGSSLSLGLVHALLAKCDIALLFGRFDSQSLRNLSLGNLLLTSDIAGTNGFLHFDFGCVCRDFRFRFACRYLRKLCGAKRFQRLHLLYLRFLFLEINLQRPLRRFHGRAPHRHLCISIDRGTFFLGVCNHLCKLAHANGVEGVVFVERGKRCLVESCQRYRFKLETIPPDFLGQGRLHLFHESTTALMQVVHGLLRGHRAQRIEKFTFYEVTKLVGFKCAAAKRLGGSGNRILGWFHRHIELDADIDTKSVLGNQRLLTMPAHFKPHGLHVDAADLVKIGQNDHPTIKDDLASSKTCAYQRHFA